MPIPEFIGSLSKLEYLNLSYANFGGIVPPQIGNLSSLHSFDLNSAFIKDNGYNTLSVGNNLHWLSQIPSLRYLDMGGVNLSMVSEGWMDDINRLPLLSVLILSNVGLNSFPATLKHVNFTFLTMLDLSNNSFGGSAITPNWLFNITSLMHLDFSGCPQVINFQFLEMLTVSHGGHLRFLNLANNDIIGEIPGRLRNLSRLEYLNFAGNQLNGSIPETVGELSQLKVLNFGHNQLTGSIPETVGNLNLLKFLHFGHNQLTGSISETVKNLFNLHDIHLNHNSIGGELPAAAIGSLYCHKLSVIHLSENNISGEVSALIEGLYECIQNRKFDKRIDQFTSYYLDVWGLALHLSGNNLNGIIPERLGQLSMLRQLDLSSNSFVGSMTEVHFSNLSNLDYLDLSYNPHLELTFTKNWVPPFNAELIYLSSCNLGPNFPTWLQNQTRLNYLNLSRAQISDIVPAWILDFRHMHNLDISHNQIRGQLPVPTQALTYYEGLDLSYNNFDGYIPMGFGLLAHRVVYFSLSHNQLSGSVPLSLCNMTSLAVLDLSNNIFSGSLPLCQHDQPKLIVLDLSNNNFTGYIPDLMEFYPLLQSLHLRNNHLTGKIPGSLKHCRKLVLLDLDNNRLSGNIPKWIGESLSVLRVLSLKSNFFYGKIPEQLSHLTSLHVLDLAHNNISSTLPPSFGNFKAMVGEMNVSEPLYKEIKYLNYEENILIIKNRVELEYTKILSMVVSIDLSSNNLYGQIPEELTNLLELQTLNLSGNHLTGKIPKNIGAMKQLESLDLSINNLEGQIPSSISALNFLHMLNLSYNNLSGEIPSGYQLQTFDISSYTGNLALCGSPLPKCSPHEENQVEKNRDKNEMIWLYASIAMGFIVGFWSVQVTLMIKSSLRIAYFHFVDNVFDRVYVKLVVNLSN